MLKFVRDGKVIFTENDLGELVWVDPEAKRQFEEAAARVNETEASLEEVHEKLHKAFKVAQTEEMRARIKHLHDAITKKMVAKGIKHEKVDELDG